MLLKNKFEKCELVDVTPDATKQLRVKPNPTYGYIFKGDRGGFILALCNEHTCVQHTCVRCLVKSVWFPNHDIVVVKVMSIEKACNKKGSFILHTRVDFHR